MALMPSPVAPAAGGGAAMPPGAPPPGAPGAAPGAGPGTPPMGASPVTAPTQNLGLAARGVQAAGALVNAMAMVIPLVGANTETGRAVAKAMLDIGKTLPPGSSTPQGESNFVRGMAMRQAQMGPQRAALAAQGGAAPTMTPPTASPRPPMAAAA